MVSVSSNCNNMAESSDDQNPFNCPICLHLLKNPVSTSCGHSFCMDCLNECWDRDDQKGVYSCPQCRQTFSPRPVLSRNTVLSEVVERMKREAPEAGTASPVLSFAVSGDVECDICTETKLKAFKACLVCLASYCESHIKTHYTSPALKWHKLANASPHLLDQICSQHHKPLELYCSQDQQLICVQCALINHQNHNLTSPAAERQKIQGRLQNQDGLQREIHQRELKVQELREAVDSHKRSAEAAVKHSEKVFTELISSMEKRRVKITDMIRAQEKSEVSRVEELVLTLEQEISDLRKKHAELGQLSLIEDDIYVIQNFLSVSRYQCSNLCDISISQHLTFEEIETVVSDLKSQLDDLCEQDILWISEKVPTIHIMVNNEKITAYLPSKPKNREEFFIYSSELNLNHSSACTQLSVKNNKSVSRRDVQQSTDSWNPVLNQSVLNSISKRTYQVLCKESLSGRCYFEVQWGGTGCSIAFSYDQINKGGGTFIFGSNNRSWKCDFPAANLCVWNNGQQTNISLVSKIGVFLDQEAGTVSFYNVSDKMTLLHRIQTTFSQPLYTGFSFKDWKNYSSVTICDLANQNE
ncbi:E3 ubiquitin/ISG15 ligase TRIM25-like isoform X1 [Sinocyclocheilus rhinocerous]|uniref:E3 ubiquitin/ISG15 ligase TRIM25-like isoform X1 n=1 Tax=Sinocyclocheilus rhinocerous TaxID=307959 RepID=UPI0007B8B0B8|nr:PREDICTED: E3 ubiquitin/ISG15 ligase TRIM25-like isoform X1 [Sinocyclocheilus rhinocerous]